MTKMNSNYYKNSFLTVGMIVFAMIPAVFSGCTKGSQEQQMKKPPVPVAVETVVLKTVPVQLRAIGTVEPASQVSIKSRIAGELVKVSFREGQDVKKGDLLFTIDTRPFKTALDSAEANLERDMALSSKAREDVNRYAELVKEELVSKSQYEQVVASAKALEATVVADRAAVENARLQLNYCYIHAPVSGRTGSLLADEGNQIKANDDKAMVVINQVQPIHVTFSVPEKMLPEIRRHFSSRKLLIEARISGEEDKPVTGTVGFIDNAVDTSTGTIKLKGIFPNKDNRLWPGQFVNVVITLDLLNNVPVVPSSAVQVGQQGHFVYVVKDDDTAEMRAVSAGEGYQSLTAITKGIQQGEKVVTDGQMRLVPGALVEIRTGPEAKSREPGAESREKVQEQTEKPAATQKNKIR